MAEAIEERAPGRPVTSVDVARRAGVSRATVSHILNHQVQRFAPATVERVLDAAAELGYVKSAAARALALGRNDIVVLIVPNTTLSNVQDVIETLSTELDGLGFATVAHFAGPEDRGAGAPLQHLVDMLRPAAVVDLGGRLTSEQAVRLESTGAAVVAAVTETGPAGMAIDGNEVIGRLQAQHLVERGFRRLAFASLSDNRGDPWRESRAAGFAAVGARHGLDAPVNVLVSLNAASAREVVARLVPGPGEQPVGIACTTDEVAIALLSAALSLGVDVPGKLGVIGLSASPVGQVLEPPLTSLAADLPASLAHVMRRLAEVYGRSGGIPAPVVPTVPENYPEEVFRVLQGGTT